MPRTTLPIGIALVASLALAACAPETGGPLRGPRNEPGVAEVCAPAGSGRTVYFGEQLTNDGGDVVVVRGASASGDNVADVTIGFDVAGPAMGQAVGTFADPTGVGGDGAGIEILARTTPPVGTEIEPGVVANLVLSIESASATDDATVDYIEVSYVSGGRDYREEIRNGYTLRPGDTC